MGRIFDGREERFGRFLDEFELGDVFRHWPGHSITEAEDHLFCLLTRAASPLHTDRHFGTSETEWGRNVVVGTYVYALLLGMSVPDISGGAVANLGLSELKHLKPFFHGDTLYGVSEVLGVRPSASRPGQGVLTVRTDGFNQHGEKVCTFTRAVLLPMRPAEAKGGKAA